MPGTTESRHGPLGRCDPSVDKLGGQPMLSARFEAGFVLASEVHRAQVRKGTSIPYIAHPVAVEAKPPWRERKEAYLRHLATATPEATLVSLADKLHNARSSLTDLRATGNLVWDRFNAPREQQLWYYNSLVQTFAAELPQAAGTLELRRVVAEMASLAARRDITL